MSGWIELRQQLRVKLAALQPRERLALAVLAGALGLTLLWLLLIAPAHSYYQEQQQRYQRNVQLGQWIASHENQFKQQRPTVPKAGNGWINQLTQVAGQQGVQVRSFTPEGSDGVRIQLESQPFASVMQWLALLEQQGIRPVQSDISATNSVGLVNVRLTLRRL